MSRIAIALLASLTGLLCSCGVGGRGFDSAVWKASPPGSEVRSSMAYDLERSDWMIGLTKEKALELLGPADNHMETPRAPERWHDLIYLLDWDKVSDSLWLMVDVNEHGQVVGVSKILG